MNRTSLDNDKGMLFVFREAEHYSFRMKNTLIPLDMIRLDEDFKILYIKNMAEPCTVDPCPLHTPWVSANYVLEIKWWRAQALGLQIGESMVLKM